MKKKTYSPVVRGCATMRIDRAELKVEVVYSPGDVITLRDRDTGLEFPALIDNVTKGGRIVAAWQRRERRGRGELTKPVTLDDRRFEIIGPAPESDRYHLTKLAESRR